jgi:general stress protein CsbA
VCWYKTLYQVEPVVWTNITTSRWVVMRLVHATGKTWYKVLYQHTVYVISLSNISIKANDKGWIKMCTILSRRLQFVHDVTLFFSVHSPMSGYCVLSHIPMIWHHVKVVRQRTSRATSHHSFITTVWWYNILYQTSYFL